MKFKQFAHFENRHAYILGKHLMYQVGPIKHEKLLLRRKFNISHFKVSIFLSVVKMLSPKSL